MEAYFSNFSFRDFKAESQERLNPQAAKLDISMQNEMDSILGSASCLPESRIAGKTAHEGFFRFLFSRAF